MQIYKEMENEDALSENVDPYRPPLTTKIKVRCQSPKYENGFKHLWHLASGNV